jgi:hypothetical protein
MGAVSNVLRRFGIHPAMGWPIDWRRECRMLRRWYLRWWYLHLPLACAIVLAGCSTGKPHVDWQDPSIVFPNRTGSVERAGVFVGIGKGFPGLCPGADYDAKTQQAWVSADRETALLLNDTGVAAGTVANTQAAMLAYNQRLPDDGSGLMTLGFSGHGTLRDRPVNADTLGAKEGGLCFADKVWWASEIAAWVTANFKPCRIEYFADCCHAESNWRAFGAAVTFGYVDNPKGPVTIKLDAPRGWGGQMIQWAGCRQNAYSYGTDPDGGTWTQTIDGVIKLRPNHTRTNLYQAARWLMPTNQVPAWTVYNASSNFIHGVVFQ